MSLFLDILDKWTCKLDSSLECTQDSLEKVDKTQNRKVFPVIQGCEVVVLYFIQET